MIKVSAGLASPEASWPANRCLPAVSSHGRPFVSHVSLGSLHVTKFPPP